MILMAMSFHREDIERHEVEIMVQRRVAGILVIPSGSESGHFADAQRVGVPIISLDRPLKNVETDTLVVENRRASTLATEHLIKHGHRDILCVADEENIFTKSERVTGYTQAVREAQLPVRVVLVGPTGGTLSDHLNLALGSNPAPTAIFATSDLHAVNLLHEFKKRSIKIPDRMAIISFDDFDSASLVDPTITVVRQPVEELGHRAASLLLSRINASGSVEFSQVELATELVVRESCGCERRPVSID